MRCRDVARLASRYIDGELDDARTSAVRGHARTCQACHALLEDHANMVEAARDLEAPDPPPALWQQVQAQLASEEIDDAERSRVWFWWQDLRRRALPAAIVVCGATVLVLQVASRLDDGHDAAARPDVAAVAQGPMAPAPVASAGPLASPAGCAVDDAPLPDDFAGRRVVELRRTDRDYECVIAELGELARAEVSSWSPQLRRDFDERLRELDAAAERHRVVDFGPSVEPGRRDALYAVLDAKVELLQRAALGDGEFAAPAFAEVSR